MNNAFKIGALLIAVGAAASSFSGAKKPEAPKPVLTKSQHDARGCQSLRQAFGESALTAYYHCGDPGPNDAIDPYDKPKAKKPV